ncbi:MAG: chemotaxis response regulator protein-glutamate methylesterase [Hormoscilla sp.]
MRIAIVNDMLMTVEVLRRVLATVPDYELAWVARNGAFAVAKCAVDCPDLILMDLLMPVMDGVEATRQIMKSTPCAILVVTSSIKANVSQVFAAMGFGALDVVKVPILGTAGKPEAAKELLKKIATIAKLIGKSSQSRIPKPSPRTTSEIPHRQAMDPLIAIGASAGGPIALAKILSRLPKNFSGAVAIVQHIDAQFAPGLAEWLDRQTPLTVKLARSGNQFQGRQVLVAGTNDHLILRSHLALSYTKEPRDYPYRPSVDVFFRSIASYWPDKGVGVLLTGMGRDGATGLSHLRAAGWHTIAQDRRSCAVYGMPKAAVELGAAVEVLSLEAIANRIVFLTEKKRSQDRHKSQHFDPSVSKFPGGNSFRSS